MSEDIQIQIGQTIEAIIRTNEILKNHQNRSEPDWFAVKQYQSIKDDLTRQLMDLLANLNINISVAA
ncbi:MAG: hypothetical protein MUF45_16255 [Spirosomaceae bacterium]|jgi:hypothetical protein|nr:hypothetical protein [Spirosomataceae bacterium]